MRRYSISIVSVFMLFGCSATTPSVNEYTLLSSKTIQPTTVPLSSKTLSVALSKSIPSLSTKNLIYLRENGETGAYLYSRWSDTPTALLQRSLLISLYEHPLFASLSASNSLAQSDWVLESDLDAFYHRFSKDKSEGYIDITYRLIDTKTKSLLGSKRFSISSPAPTMDAQGGVDALQKATDELNTQCILWLTTLTKEIK
jgi:cholesterol transport system auxiliary component